MGFDPSGVFYLRLIDNKTHIIRYNGVTKRQVKIKWKEMKKRERGRKIPKKLEMNNEGDKHLI